MHSLMQTRREALTIFNLTLAAFILSEVRIRASRPAYTGDANNDANQRSRGFTIVGLAVGFIGAFQCDINHVGPLIAGRSWALFWTGIAVALVGIAVRQWAVISLGRFFQLQLVIQNDHGVVRRGPYRLLRHPSYAGVLLTCIGIGLALGRWSSLLFAFLVPLATVVHRIGLEERLLLEGLGDEYADYRKNTWRLIPGVW